jgi:hypothetical protein
VTASNEVGGWFRLAAAFTKEESLSFKRVNMTNEQIEALRKKWESNGGKTVDISDVKEGIDPKEFIESLTYSKTPEEKRSA